MTTQLHTQSTTAGWAALADARGHRARILNKTGAVLDLRMAGNTEAANTITIDDNDEVTLLLSANLREVQIKGAGVAAGVHILLD